MCVFFILMATCAEITIVMVYFQVCMYSSGWGDGQKVACAALTSPHHLSVSAARQLCNEDYQWWWRSFLSSGSAAFYLFAYSIWCVRPALRGVWAPPQSDLRIF